MNTQPDMLSHFHFQTMPFTPEVRVADRFRLSAHDETLNHLRQTVEQRMSAALIAPAGTGKTTLLRALVEALPEARYHTRYLKVTDLSKRDFCREISTALGLGSAGTYPALVRRLQEHMEQIVDQEAMRCVLILDEAHDFRPHVLSIIRILTNFEMDSRLVFSVLLSGQMGLGRLLDNPILTDVTGRLAHRAQLQPLSLTEVKEYITHRCAMAGLMHAIFETEAMTALYEIGHGNLRATDRLALKALHVAHQAKASAVTSNHVAKARGLL